MNRRSAESLLWYDLETTGDDPRVARIVQIAAQRTDLELNPVEAPLVVWVRPDDDLLPAPEACLITGLTPQRVASRGAVGELAAIQTLLRAMARPNTCSLGYNSIRFDDEVVRQSLFRNLLDPYAREYGAGRSRWDIIDTVRACRALRPYGIAWPNHDSGATSYRLEDLARANGLAQDQAHDALSDVQATIALARLVREKQPRLYDYAFGLRGKRAVQQLLDDPAQAMWLHVSGMYPDADCRLSAVASLAPHPENGNGVLAYDLRHDPAPFFGLSVAQMRERLFTPAAELPADTPRLPVKTIALNHCPLLAPVATLDSVSATRCALDLDTCAQHAQKLRAAADFIANLVEANRRVDLPEPVDADFSIYSGGFLPDADRRRLAELHASPPATWREWQGRFQDPRLDTLLLRMRARNQPDTLTPDEHQQWNTHCRRRLAGDDPKVLGLTEYRARIAALGADADARAVAILDELTAHGNALAARYGIDG
ncbi:MAG: exodeoxyribonuclease I [Chromatiales bacterium]|nr:exodeoxyribonuclease I [Chromatiales bacterium]